jgi:hypothetical protein
MPIPQVQFDPNVNELIEQRMEDSSKSYFKTTLNFIKWNTAISIGAVLWLGNYVVTTTIKLDQNLKFIECISLGFFLASVFISVVIFYGISKYFKECWILNTRWRNSYLVSSSSCATDAEQIEVNEVISSFAEHVRSLPKKAETFDNLVTLQLILQFLGLICFFAFIILVKPAI